MASSISCPTLQTGPTTMAGSIKRARATAAYILVTPATLLLMALIIGPAIMVMGISLTDWEFGSETMNFIGLENFGKLCRDHIFRASVINTLLYTMATVPLSIFLGLAVALLIEAGRSLRSIYRAVYFIPVMTTTVVMALIWGFVLQPNIGYLGMFLKLFGIHNLDLLRNESLALMTLAGIGVWQMVGFNMVLFMAGLSGISSDLYDAAQVDGADGWWESFRLVTWPMLSPVTLFVSVITAIRSFQVFDTVHVLTQGGPSNATEVLLHTMYTEAFQFFRTGYAASISVVFLIGVLILTVVKTMLIEKKVHYS